ncbi:N-acetylglucosamine-6-phosphate deacetylase [Ciceribacter ferrooxidans]|uniref:N-acetylglucosamine-6-phosphate deacetylase n=1 Tax=Ciceribacter ferrooxidans TaxID=2509717 RepID=A0A4Q2TF24_9HYPH|nr:N-acetylglucosamine-6-phosphate deacetylase [Ciceribacter ferrooxidans]RYC17290.1 N-acetylglucosamine-6-phosphate deacetylase [Ciceribacter ferrooxidans]
MSAPLFVVASRIFDGERFLTDTALLVEGGKVKAHLPAAERPAGCRLLILDDATVVPGFVDLQVNGGGGVLFNNAATLDGIRTICETHARFGTTSLMVTLITDTANVRENAIEAAAEAAARGLPGYLGLHFEGPHLSLARKGTHDPALVRPMTSDDLAALVACGSRIGHAMTTVAPENVTPSQVSALVDAGFNVSLGHTDCRAADVPAYVAAGASLITHLFNAMSQLGNREPGLVGAALSEGALHCGLIADGFHVDPVTMGVALRAKRGPGRIFLVTDAMSSIGSDETGFELNGRQVYRRDGRLTLADGTLAGADIDMLSSVRLAHRMLDLPLEEALRMASAYPAEAIGAPSKGRLMPDCDADFLVLSPELDLRSTWIGGERVFDATAQAGANR